MQPSPNIDYFQLPHIYSSVNLAIGKRIIVLGESTKGSLYDPIAVTSVTLAKKVFGEGPLIERFKDLYLGGQVGAYLMRVERNALQTSLSTLLKFPFDLIYIDGVYFDTHPEAIQKFIQFAQDKEYQGQLIHGFFDVKDLDSMESIRTIYSDIKSLTQTTENGDEELGKYFSVVFDQMKDHHAAAVYAGLVASLNPEKSPVNKTLNVELKQELSKEDMQELSAAGIVCFKDSLKKGVVCSSSSCAVATSSSASKHISNLRIAQFLIQEIADRLQEYVGRIGIEYIITEAEAIIQSIAESYMDAQRIKRYDYTLEPDRLRGVINIEIEIVPIFSVYTMTQTSQVRVRT
ncbi:hypothetical protein TCA2_4538 [Paenibacillus sp. TCA20]|uniref:hypothetical protein n=1 Tax=Paenibacillus sp. TCA20 TaxID=1499968 RepID=UPI0004D3D2F8|nr:hypothetical protein [Paenibacillus sp. TCA20]GAK42046.1 hypothetical protein TCA2_4538 [Paenibacillus sp. TCA20]